MPVEKETVQALAVSFEAVLRGIWCFTENRCSGGAGEAYHARRTAGLQWYDSVYWNGFLCGAQYSGHD